MAKTVLVIDDDPTQRRLIQAVLEREGFAFEGAESGPVGLDRLAQGGVDVVLLDMVMPQMPGLEVLKQARLSGVACPVIILTANAGIDTVVEAMRAGAQDFFVNGSPQRPIDWIARFPRAQATCAAAETVATGRLHEPMTLQ